jgi:small subunit ribosomal protein S2
MNLLYISIIQLSKYKIYIGHSIHNTILSSSWLIFKIRGRITILNLFHTLKMLKLSYVLIKYVINMGFPFWFVDFNLTKEDIIKNSASNTGEFYVTRRWIRGLISNFYVITKEYRYYLMKKAFIDSNKVRDIFDKWIYTRFSWPRAIFISSTENCYIVAKEAANAKIASIGLVDVNVKSHIYNIPIPCNDDSLESITFMHNIIMQYIMQCKYKKVLIWYYFNRNIERFKTLTYWLKNLVQFKKKLIYKINIKKIFLPNVINNYKSLNNGFNFFFGRSAFLKFSKKQKDINMENDDFIYDKFYDLNKIFIYNKFNVLNYRNFSYKYRIKFKRKSFLNKIEGISLFKSFLNNFIRLNDFSAKKFKRTIIKKRIKMERKKIPVSFKHFYSFIFFFYLNKFNIMIDSFIHNNINLHYLVRLYKKKKKKQLYYKNKFLEKNKDINSFDYKQIYAFRYKSKKIYKWKKQRRYVSLYKKPKSLNKNLNFLFFYWKNLVMFLGLKLRKKNLNYRSKYRIKKRYIVKLK